MVDFFLFKKVKKRFVVFYFIKTFKTQKQLTTHWSNKSNMNSMTNLFIVILLAVPLPLFMRARQSLSVKMGEI